MIKLELVCRKLKEIFKDNLFVGDEFCLCYISDKLMFYFMF